MCVCGQARPRRWRAPVHQMLLDYVLGTRPVNLALVFEQQVLENEHERTRENTSPTTTIVHDGDEAACTVSAENCWLVSASTCL